MSELNPAPPDNLQILEQNAETQSALAGLTQKLAELQRGMNQLNEKIDSVAQLLHELAARDTPAGGTTAILG